tara:strand:- start:672 stop:1142 length:471 start_codon:yes stop_codon:yes gene_type:complete
MSADTVELREPVLDDFERIFPLTQDPAANTMAKIFPRTREAFAKQWERMVHGDDTQTRLIVLEGEVVGCINSFQVEDETQVGYMIAQAHWGKGIGSRALKLFIELFEHRPLIAHVAKSNIGSCRILEKCGFIKTEERDSPETERYMACIVAVYELR